MTSAKRSRASALNAFRAIIDAWENYLGSEGSRVNDTPWDVVQSFRAVLDQEEALKHGAYATYTNHGCRCDACKEAMSNYSKSMSPYQRDRKARRS